MTINHQTDVPAHVRANLVLPYDYLRSFQSFEHPPSALDGLREDYPAFYSNFYGGYWVLTRYEDIRAVFSDPDVYRQWPDGVPAAPFGGTNIPIHLNPPTHTVYRKILMPLFTPRRIAKLEADVRQIARQQLEKLRNVGRCEFVRDFALTLPAAMYCSLLGLPLERFRIFNDLSNQIIYGPIVTRRERGEEAGRAVRATAAKQVRQLLASLMHQRRAEPGDDLIGFLLAARLDGEKPLTDDEIINIAATFFYAGTDSTAAAISYAFLFLASHPGHRKQLIEHPEYLSHAAEELLRYNSFHHIARVVVTDVELAGVQIKAGDIILLPTGAANHDHRQYPNANQVDFSRRPHGQLSFGGGIHRCIGAGLATLQVRISLEEVHQAFPEYQLDPEDPVTYISGTGKTVPHRLPLLLSPRGCGD
jgi:cytochrome P450